MGEIIPPCLTPLPTRKSGEVELPLRTHIFWCVYQKSSNLTINNGTCISIFSKIGLVDLSKPCTLIYLQKMANGKLHKFATTNSNFEKIIFIRHASS